MHFVDPKNVELFFLRVLLLHVPNACSFDDLKCVDGQYFDTFREAAIARRLAREDDEWVSCMEEAVRFRAPSSLRNLFCVILVFCEPSDPTSLYERFKFDLAEDFTRFHDDETAFSLAIRDMNRIFAAHNTTASNFGIIAPYPNVSTDWQEHSSSNLSMATISLNNEQNAAFELMKIALDNNGSDVPQAFFLDGPGETGKTTFYKYLAAYCEEQSIRYTCVASTGIASTLLPNGKTAHSAFKLPLNLNESSISSMNINSKSARNLKETKLIIWDEATMSSKHALRVVDDFLKDIMENDTLFGGKVMLLGGDFRQCLPVVVKGNKTRTLEETIKFMLELSDKIEIHKKYEGRR